MIRFNTGIQQNYQEGCDLSPQSKIASDWRLAICAHLSPQVCWFLLLNLDQEDCRPATAVSPGSLGPSCPCECPRKQRERPMGYPRGPSGPAIRSFQKVSRECPWSVKKVSWTLPVSMGVIFRRTMFSFVWNIHPRPGSRQKSWLKKSGVAGGGQNVILSDNLILAFQAGRVSDFCIAICYTLADLDWSHVVSVGADCALAYVWVIRNGPIIIVKAQVMFVVFEPAISGDLRLLKSHQDLLIESPLMLGAPTITRTLNSFGII